MSKPYRIKVNDVVVAQDSSRFHIDPVPFVTPSEFTEMLSQVLEESGWERDPEGRLTTKDEHGEVHTFDPECLEISTVLGARKEIEQTLEGWHYNGLRNQAESIVERTEELLESEVSEALDERYSERHLMLQELVVEATGRAIKEAAQKLGDVQNIHETRGEGGEYRLTITIEEYE